MWLEGGGGSHSAAATGDLHAWRPFGSPSEPWLSASAAERLQAHAREEAQARDAQQ